MKFTKMHGCGNDYIYVNCFEESLSNPNEISRIVSDRHFGIGSDGLICICPSETADFRMAMYNADGTEGKMCGNGIRCVAKYVYDYKLTDKTTITVETLSGIKTLDLDVENGSVKTVTVDMGAPSLTPADVPVVIPGGPKDAVVNTPITITVEGKDTEYRMTCISMGNPHAIIFTDDVHTLNLEKIGPLFEKHPYFPEQVNTEFIHVIDRNQIDMRVWERGSGETLACGTGACASVVACVLNGLTENNVTVHLLGGDLTIHYDQDKNTVFMTGPAAIICTGSIEI